jgi:hypothetical protein
MGTAASTISNPTINIEHHECDLTTTTTTTSTQQVDFQW